MEKVSVALAQLLQRGLIKSPGLSPVLGLIRLRVWLVGITDRKRLPALRRRPSPESESWVNTVSNTVFPWRAQLAPAAGFVAASNYPP